MARQRKVSPRERLAGVRPDLAARVTRVLDAMEALGWPMGVTDGIRTVAQQQALHAQGRTRPGPIVTYCDGVTVPGPHVEGRACDCAFLIDGTYSWDARLPWAAYGALAEAVGLHWGGRWKRPVDAPHVEIRKA